MSNDNRTLSKKKFTNPSLEVIVFGIKDIISTSNGNENNPGDKDDM